MSYSILTEPAIPVLMADGTRTAMGIRDIFSHAHEIQDIQALIPLERYAVFRLLVAFSMDVFHPKDSYARQDLLAAGRFDIRAFDAYVDECEKDGPRFDLFDAEHPFLQSRYDEQWDVKPNVEKPVATLFHFLPSGNNHVFFDHRIENTHDVPAAEAFRALCACYLFSISNKSGPGSINGTPPLYAIAIRQNLFETLVANMLSEAEAQPLDYGVGKTPWRNGRVIIPNMEVPNVSLLEGLTWMSRRVTLIPNNDHKTVARIRFQPGLKFNGNELWVDPYVPCYRKNETYVTVKPQFGRFVWRDVGALLYDRKNGAIRQPPVLQCMKENLLDDDETSAWVPIRVAGLAVSTKLKYEEWCEEELRLPSLLLCDENLANQFRADISMVEFAQRALYSNVQKYVDFNDRKQQDTSKEQRKKTDSEFACQCRQYFLHKAHNLLFGECLAEVCGAMDVQEHTEHFRCKVKRLLKETMVNVLGEAGTDRKNLMKRMVAERQIWREFERFSSRPKGTIEMKEGEHG